MRKLQKHIEQKSDFMDENLNREENFTSLYY